MHELVRFASEDVGMADSNALQTAVAAYQACHFLGMPECDVHLTHAVRIAVAHRFVESGNQVVMLFPIFIVK